MNRKLDLLLIFLIVSFFFLPAAALGNILTHNSQVASSTSATQLSNPNHNMISGHFIKYLSSNGVVPLTIFLAINITGAQKYALESSDPSSALFHHFLTPREFFKLYGPSASEVVFIKNWLLSQGMTDVKFANGDQMTFNCTISDINTVFHTKMGLYNIGAYKFYSNLTKPVIPSAIEPYISSLIGFNNFNPVFVKTFKSINTFSQNINGNLAVTPSDVYSYFGINKLRSNGIEGQGISIALVGGPEAGFLTSDVNYFWKHYEINYFYGDQLYNPYVNEIAIGGGGNPSMSPSSDSSVEETLDIEWAGVTTPAATIDEVIYNAPWYEPWNDGFEHGFLQELSYIVNTLKPDVMSTSFGYPSNYIYSNWPNDLNTIHNYLVQAADEGITVVAASGDSGYSSSGQIAVVAADPFSIAVGGVSVSLSSSGINGETGWSYSTGGYTPYDGNIYSQPTYQSIDPQVPHNGYRDVPDLAFVAAPYIATYFNGGFVAYSGTSYAAPMFAGIIAGLDQNGGGAYGFINNAIYDVPYTSGAYNDITTGNNGVPAGNGWDYVTGFGSVNALPFIQQVEDYYACNCH